MIFTVYLTFHCIVISWFVYQLDIWDVSSLILLWAVRLWEPGIRSPDTNKQLFQKWWYLSISTPMYVNLNCCLCQHLALLKFLIFANIVGVKCYPVMSLIFILLLLKVFSLFIGSSCFCVCFSVKKENAYCRFLNLVICFFFSICKNSLWNHILFLLMSVSILLNCKILWGKGQQLLYWYIARISIGIQLLYTVLSFAYTMFLLLQSRLKSLRKDENINYVVQNALY